MSKGPRGEEHIRLLESELAEATRRIEQLDRLRREYLSNVGHEFRTPLTVIRGDAAHQPRTVEKLCMNDGGIAQRAGGGASERT